MPQRLEPLLDGAPEDVDRDVDGQRVRPNDTQADEQFQDLALAVGRGQWVREMMLT